MNFKFRIDCLILRLVLSGLMFNNPLRLFLYKKSLTRVRAYLFLISIALLIVSCNSEIPPEVTKEYQELPSELDFNLHVKPILSDKCFLCHGPDKANQKAGLRLDDAEVAYSRLEESGRRAITPGNLYNSEVFHRILSEDPESRMPEPQSNLVLSDYEKAVIIKWIEEGAEYKPHWSFIKPEKVELPQVNNQEQVKTPIDNFVISKLEQNNLNLSEEAGKELLLRRISFDLTGLPPKIDEIESYLSDDSENAYEKQVDRLLASVHYGEKMAGDWMDVARFADTHGYTVDRYRDMSPWRDWVIKAFNENMPYDQFITWQIAGDLLPSPTKEQLLATAFNRIHPQNMEGGIIPEEFRVEYVLDRVNTSGQAFMALTVGCSKCHDHKYDPISQKEYYEMSAFFNNVNEAGQISWDDAMPVPTMLLTTEKEDSILSFLSDVVNDKERDLDDAKDKEAEQFEQWLAREKYRTINFSEYPESLLAHFAFEDGKLNNRIRPSQKGKMKQIGSEGEKPKFVEGRKGDGLYLDGDAWMDTQGIGAFRRYQPFSISINVKIPDGLEDGVIFHKGDGAAIYCYKGFHLALENNTLQLMMAHTAPDNAIIEYTKTDIPRDTWINLTMTYDGSSKASGLRVFMDGNELETEIEIDNLYKDIHFKRKDEPGVQVGARWRGKGIGGSTVDDLMIFDEELTGLEVIQLSDRKRVNSIISKDHAEFNAQEKSIIKEFYFNHHSSTYKALLAELEYMRLTHADSIENVQEVMIMKEMPENRKTYLLERGIYDSYGEEVFANTPPAILPIPDDLPRNRLGFAKWLLDEDHPLTARVTVNRIWQNFFGQGLVKTTEDFGNQGALPSHPDLLDWLAVDFMESGWDLKRLQKMIVMSSTYRQSSIANEHLQEIDPDNVLLARGPVVRLSAEMMRDNALLASGLLNAEIGGKSVNPYQPEGLWRVNNAKYIPDSGDKLYRRSMYTIWKRSVPHPTLGTFDAPDRSECTVRRQETNTPLQALVLLNDPIFVEASKVMGEYIAGADKLEKGVREVFIKLTGRAPLDSEMEILLDLQRREYQKFQQQPEKKEGWIRIGEYKIDGNSDLNLIAANAVVASAILNSDATITKR